MLVIDGLSKFIDGKRIFGPISLSLDTAQVLFIVGPSGSGKTLLLRLVSCLDIPNLKSTSLLLDGKTPNDHGLTEWRRQCMYCPQGRVAMQGTPEEFWNTVLTYKANAGKETSDLSELIGSLGLEPSVLQQQWSELSGGQAQRVALSIAVALKPAVLLLDEPTSALDHAATLMVEQMLMSSGCALIWVSHTEGQPERVGGRILQLSTGQIQDIHPGV